MQNYKETQVTGTQYTRCKRLELLNPQDDRQVVIFDEETVLQLSEDERISRDEGKLTIVVDPDRQVTHYESGEVMTYGELYKWMVSAYLAEALERDALKNAVNDEPEEEPEEEGDVDAE